MLARLACPAAVAEGGDRIARRVFRPAARRAHSFVTTAELEGKVLSAFTASTVVVPIFVLLIGSYPEEEDGRHGQRKDAQIYAPLDTDGGVGKDPRTSVRENDEDVSCLLKQDRKA